VKDEGATGLIVAGYGLDDGFPSVYSINIEGILLGKLKHTEIQEEAVITTYSRGRVVSFAQTDVIDRLLDGVDPGFIHNSANLVEKGIERIGSRLEEFGKTRRWTKAEKTARAEAIAELAEIAKEEYYEAADAMTQEFRLEFEGMIAMMPRTELIEFAEALINITAIERKAGSDQGSVGGPVDVAFITKHEGFVWIKRKHYFDADKNPRYFWRNFRVKPTPASLEGEQ
jgi:hypothetical protein